MQIKTPGSKGQTGAKAPLMPSADASKDSLDATFSYKPKPRADLYKNKKKLDPAQQRQMLDHLIEKSVQLGKKKAMAQKPTAPAFVEPPKDNKEEQALALITAKHSAEKTNEEQPEP